jgi:hypothetical protein
MAFQGKFAPISYKNARGVSIAWSGDAEARPNPLLSGERLPGLRRGVPLPRVTDADSIFDDQAAVAGRSFGPAPAAPEGVN